MIGFYNYTVILTYLSLVSSTVGIFLGMNNHIHTAVCCLLFSGFCDMFDGKIARTMKRTDSEKRFGIQIDSLSDLICFGVLPAVIGFRCGMDCPFLWPILALYILCALIRLAYFNVREEERQAGEGGRRKTYDGLPVTSIALILPIIYVILNFVKAFSGISNMGYLTLTSVVFSIMLFAVAAAFISPFKIKKPDSWVLYVFLAIGAVLFILIIVFKLMLPHIIVPW